jgi:excisionase family DNA binding protein
MPEAIELLTPNETAALLGMSKGTLEVWRSTKRYPLDFVKIGGRVRYRRQDVEKFLEVRTVRCGPEATTKVRRKRCS